MASKTQTSTYLPIFNLLISQYKFDYRSVVPVVVVVVELYLFTCYNNIIIHYLPIGIPSSGESFRTASSTAFAYW